MLIRILKRRGVVLCLLAATLFFTSFHHRDARAQELVCPPRGIQQITNGFEGGSQDAWIDGAGTRIAFQSRANINGENTGDNFEIFIFDTFTGLFTQVTDTPDGSNVNPSISENGLRVAFQSDADILGPNVGDNRQVYIYDIPTGIITQVTDAPMGDSFVPVLNSDGTVVAFVSDADLTGMNGDGNDEIFVFNTAGGTITQITDTTETNRNPSINGDGTLIVFQSPADITGGNPNGINQIFLFDITSGMFTQITIDPTEGSFDPAISADGNRIAIETRADINGGNPDGNIEIYVFDRSTMSFIQVTNEIDFSSEDYKNISSDGTRLAFDSRPDNIDQIFLGDTNLGINVQITNGTANSSRPSINADGTRIAFHSDADVTGGNPQLVRQVYIATCFDPATFRNIPTLSEWGLIAMAGVLGIIGLFVIRRRKLAA